jgi:glycosyltransferase involved in cell wall biosynthesis
VSTVFSSTIVPTIVRPTLARAVESVLDQCFSAEAFEVIVVNDSGQQLADAAWRRASNLRIIETQRHERSVARNTGAAIARGTHLHFLDDDDWLLPGALQSMWELAQASPADWLYGASKIVDRHANPQFQLQHTIVGNAFVQVMAGEWIPLQASFIKTQAFFAAGGFGPLLPAAEDIDLCRRVALRGPLAGTPAVIACIAMGREDSSTDYDRHPGYSRWAREQILSAPGVFARLQESATDSFWHGRVARAYLTSAVWNAQHGRGFTAASRALFGIAAIARSARHLRAGAFWRATAKKYTSDAFQRHLQVGS